MVVKSSNTTHFLKQALWVLPLVLASTALALTLKPLEAVDNTPCPAAPTSEHKTTGEVSPEKKAKQGPKLTIKGSWQQGEMLIGKAPANASIQFQGQPIMVAEDGLFIIALGHNEAPLVELELMDAEQRAHHYRCQVEQREYPTEFIEGIPKAIMQPGKADLERIHRDALAIRKSRANISWQRDFIAPFTLPLKGPTTGVYGSRRFYNGQPRRPHFGWDIAAPTGTPVRAPAAGEVVFAQLDTFYSGGLLIIDHGFKLSSSFLHLSAIHVTVGASIEQGDIIAAVGATGRVTGPHLDWRMNWGKRRLDPQRLRFAK